MKVAGFYEESISNGLGWRAVLFVSGCPHKCAGCHNENSWDFNYGEEFDKNKIINKIANNSILKGVTVTGGEPLCTENIAEVLDFIRSIKRVKPELNIWCYTGYTIEQLLNREDTNTKDCLEQIDVLVDGKFVETQKNETLKFRGSENQRIIDINTLKKENKIVEILI